MRFLAVLIAIIRLNFIIYSQGECLVPSNSLLCSPARQLFSLLLENHQSLFRPTASVRPGDLSFFLSFFPSIYSLFHAFISESDCTPLQSFYEGSIQSNQQLALSRLMHSSTLR
jgi:hypothetical protein